MYFIIMFSPPGGGRNKINKINGRETSYLGFSYVPITFIKFSDKKYILIY